MIKLREGAWYRTRDGQNVYRIHFYGSMGGYPCQNSAADLCWTIKGHLAGDTEERDLDLVEEVEIVSKGEQKPEPHEIDVADDFLKYIGDNRGSAIRSMARELLRRRAADPKPKEYPGGWMNVYGHGEPVYTLKSWADACAKPNRIACVQLPEFKSGDGL